MNARPCVSLMWVCVCVWMCVCINVCGCVNECVWVCMQVCVCEWVWLDECAYMWVCVNVHMNVCVCVCVWERERKRESERERERWGELWGRGTLWLLWLQSKSCKISLTGILWNSAKVIEVIWEIVIQWVRTSGYLCYCGSKGSFRKNGFLMVKRMESLAWSGDLTLQVCSLIIPPPHPQQSHLKPS